MARTTKTENTDKDDEKEKRRVKGEGSFFQRSNGLWVGVVEGPLRTDGTRQKKTVTSMDRNKAIQKWNKLKRDIADGVVPTDGRITLADWLDIWVKEVASKKMRPNSLANTRTYVNRHLVPHLGKKKLEDLTPALIRKMENKILEDRSPMTVRHVHWTLNDALELAVKERRIRENPASHVDPPPLESEEREALTLEEARHVLKIAFNSKDPYRSLRAAYLLTGARQGELLGLTWDRVDFEEMTLDFEWALQRVPFKHGCGTQKKDKSWPCGRIRGGNCPHRELDIRKGLKHIHLEDSCVFVPPKTKKSRRKIPMPAPLAEVLKQHYAETQPNRHNLVWTEPNGSPVHKVYDLRRWKSLVAESGIERNVVLHAARHTTASLLLEAGVDEAVIMSILGHTTVLTTRRYAHTNLSMAREALGRLDSLISLEPADTEVGNLTEK